MKKIDEKIEKYLDEAVSKCPVCGKKVKENTYGDKRYCQGHDIWDKGGKKKTNEAASPGLGSLPNQLKDAQKRAADAIKQGFADTMKAMDEYAKETCVGLYKGDIQRQSECFSAFYAKLITFVQTTWEPYMSYDVMAALVSEIDDHAKFIRKKYGWYDR